MRAELRLGRFGKCVWISVIVWVVIACNALGDALVGLPGSGAGQTLNPTGLSVFSSDGTLFVADRGNRRIDVFASDQSFVRAFGWGVVASGPGDKPRNEIEKVEIAAIGGSFTLLFIQNSEATIGPIKQETSSISFDASAAQVQSALELLPAIAPGDVAVSGSAGGPYTVEFIGSYADTDVHELEEGSASDLIGGAGELKITTTQLGANYEVCEAADGDVCRAGQLGIMSGQLSPVAVAVDPATGDVYVFDGLESSSTEEDPNNRVQKFTAEGEFLYMLGGGVNVTTGADLCTAASGDVCGRGAKGTGTGEFNAESSSLAVGPGGILYVNDGGRVQKFTPAGAPAGEVSLVGARSRFLAVDSAGDIYTADSTAVRKYDPTGSEIDSTPVSNLNAIALDETDDLYVSSLDSGRFGISRYDSAGNPELVFYSESGFAATAVAPYPPVSGGDVYAVESGRVNLIPFPPAGPVVYPVAGITAADPIGNVRATLNAEINPEGKATTYHFEYVEQAAFEAEGWASTAVKETPESASIGSDFLLHEVSTQIGCADPDTESSSCLTPDTAYRFRAVASNADGSDRVGPDATFATKSHVEFKYLWTTGVGLDSATLHAEANPVGFQTTGYFELVTEAQFEATEFAGATRIPAGAPLDFGSGEAFLERTAVAESLQPGTAYRYRLVVENNCKPLEPSFVCVSESDPERFATFAPPEPLGGCANEALRPGPAAFLPDCRGYEMVSPVDKDGTNVEVVFNISGFLANLDQSATDGQAITYSAYKAFADPEGSPYSSQFISRRGASGWTTESISPPREGPTLYNTAGLDYQFKAFTDDLCSGWPLQDTAKPLLAPGGTPDYPNLYRRVGCGAGAPFYEALTSVEPPNLAPTINPRLFFPELQGFSADGSRSFFVTKDKLTSNARKNISQVYEANGGQLKLVCVLPDGTVGTTGCSLGTSVGAGDGAAGSGNERIGTLTHAVSEDGSKVFWSLSPDGPGRLYVRVDGQETIAISELVSPEPAKFWRAAADGSKAIFSIGGNLYEFDLQARSADLIAGGSVGVAGASDDASHLYLSSTQVLAPGATAGKSNLYFAEGGDFRFIATGAIGTARVTPSGEQIVFMSNGSLTGYDNTDALNKEADAEVFLYDAAADGGAGQLVCVSCNPSGARPEGEKLTNKLSGSVQAAGWITPHTNQLYAPRVVSDDGTRVYFNSFESLVSNDSNDAQDVYQWQAEGQGSCTQTLTTHVPSAAGCISLVSSGESPEDSELVDSSASGDDVFFKTYSSLAPSDPGLLDIYDARVGGGSAAAPIPLPECQGESCLGPVVPGAPGPTPPSATFVGPGNQAAKPKPKRCPKGKHKVKRKGRTVCVKNKKKSAKKKSSQDKSRRAGR